MQEGHAQQAPGVQGSQVAADRRRFERFIEEVTVRFRDLEADDPSRWGQTRNLSLGGLCLLTEGPVRVRSHLAFEIHIVDESAPVLALGTVRRCEVEPGGYASGVEFLWVSREDRRDLERLARHFRSKYGRSG